MQDLRFKESIVMNLGKKSLIIAAFFSFLSPLHGQETSFSIPTPPVMETPKVTPTTDVAVVEALNATPERIASVSEEIKVTAPQELTELGNGVNIGLSAETRQKIATILNKLLSDEYVLYTKTLKFHWNVTGIVFHDFHEAFKEQYEKLFTIVDDIAERARALGALAPGSLQEFSTFTRLKEIKAEKLTPLDMVKQLLADHESIIRQLRNDIAEIDKLGDSVTSNFLQEIAAKHEKIAWMLRATAAQ